MPTTDDAKPDDPNAPDGYLERPSEWCDRNLDAVRWLIDNHRAIRAALTSPAKVGGDERERFEASYAAKWSEGTGSRKTADDVKALRNGDSYFGGWGYLNGQWDGWQARATLSADGGDRKDAERWRWLRDEHIGDDPEAIGLKSVTVSGSGLDATIDAAITAKGDAK